VNHVSLFSGIGGIDHAAEWAGFRTIAQVERDPYCLRVLEKHWPNVHRCREIRDFPDKDYGAVTLVSGGFPCQPFSAAGKRRGKEDDRYLWPEMRRVIAEIKPTWVLAENVAGLASMAQLDSLPELGPSAGDRYRIGDVCRRTGPGILKTILEEIETLGYEVAPIIVPAAGAGANHYRYRIFVVAYSSELERTTRTEVRGEFQRMHENREKLYYVDRPSQDVADTEGLRGSAIKRNESDRVLQTNVADTASPGRRSEGGAKKTVRESGKIKRFAGCDWWAVEPDVGRVAHGVPHRVDRLRALGNAVVPRQVYPILQAIAEVERESI